MHKPALCQDVLLYSLPVPFVILQQLQYGVQLTFLLLFLLLQQQDALLQLLQKSLLRLQLRRRLLLFVHLLVCSSNVRHFYVCANLTLNLKYR